jgi:hypothetical protein
MTHIENIPHILVNGITHRNSPNANIDYVSIGDTSLINTRAAKQVTVTNGNRSCPVETITLGNFIPFYFGIRMPMLYVVQQGGNCVEKATPPKDIVYLVCNVEALVRAGTAYCFSDGHATDALTLFYNSSRINDLPAIINWNAVKAQYWSGEENLILRCKKQAEFLVATDILPQFVCRFGCYNQEAHDSLVAMGITSEKIKTVPQAYY